MANTAYSGLTGSGKSYGVVENVIIPSLEAVLVDFPDAQIFQFTTEEWLENPELFDSDDVYPWGALYVIDEASDLYPAGQSVDKTHPSMRAFVKMHRHRVGVNGFSNENVFIDQSMAQCSVFLRKQIHFTYCAKKLSAISEKRYIVAFYEGCYDGSEPNGKQATTFQGSYKKTVYRYYKSHTLNATSFTSALERVSDRRFSIFKNKWWMLYLPAGVMAGVWGVSSLYDFFDGGFESDSVDEIQTVAVVSKSDDDVDSSPVVSASFSLHPSLRLAGRVGDSYAVFDKSSQYRVVSADACDSGCVVDGYLVTHYSGGF